MSALTIGSLTLSPSFSSDVLEYTVITTNTTNKITAVTNDPSAVIAIDVNGTAIENETSPTWASGENTITITVTDAESVTEYVVTVTKTTPVTTTLSSIEIDTLTLTPEFDSVVSNYTASTTDISNTIAVTSTDERATIIITVNDEPHTNGESATWETGENVVVIHVGDPIFGSSSNSYYVTVTKSE